MLGLRLDKPRLLLPKRFLYITDSGRLIVVVFFYLIDRKQQKTRKDFKSWRAYGKYVSTIVQRGDLVVSLAEYRGVRVDEQGVVTRDVWECEYGVKKVIVAWENARYVNGFACKDLQVIN